LPPRSLTAIASIANSARVEWAAADMIVDWIGLLDSGLDKGKP